MTDNPEGHPLTEHDQCPDREVLRQTGWKASIYGATEAAIYVSRYPTRYVDVADTTTPRETPP